MLVPLTRMVRMAVGDDRARNRSPWIQVDIGLLTVDAAVGEGEEGHGWSVRTGLVQRREARENVRSATSQPNSQSI